MCFSPPADLVGGIVVGGIGVDACRHPRGRNSHLLLAGLPILLGGHQIVEAFVWWGVQGHVPHHVERIALWIYLLVAFVVLPVFVPVAVTALEPTTERRRQQVPFVILGILVSAVSLFAMVRGPIGAVARPHHIEYSVNIGYGGVVVALYVLAVCGAAPYALT